MSIQDFRDAVKKKNYDHSFGVLSDTLETLGGSGTAPQAISVSGGFEQMLPSFTSELVEITTTGNSDPIYVGMPLGTQPLQKVRLIWKADTSEGAELFTSFTGYSIYDHSHTYSLGNLNFDGLNSTLDLQWDINQGHWVVIDYYAIDGLTSPIVGKTTYYRYMTISQPECYIITGNHDIYASAVVDTEDSGTFTISLNYGYYSGQRAFIEASKYSGQTLKIQSNFREGSTNYNIITLGDDNTRIAFEWRDSTQTWNIVDRPASAIMSMEVLL